MTTYSDAVAAMAAALSNTRTSFIKPAELAAIVQGVTDALIDALTTAVAATQAHSSNLDAIAALTPAKGTLIAGTAGAWSMLGAGANGYVLTCDTTQADGVSWMAPGAASVDVTATYAWTAQHTWSLGTITTSKPLDIAETWNASGVAFVARSVSVTNTASASGSLLDKLSVGGTAMWSLDKSGNAVAAGSVTAGASSALVLSGRSQVQSPADGNLLISNNAAADFSLLQFGGISASFPALKRSTTTLRARLADDSGDTSILALNTVKARVNFAGASGAINNGEALNVSSVSRSGAGIYTLTMPSGVLSNATPNITFGAAETASSHIIIANYFTVSTTSIQIICWDINAATFGDPVSLSVTIMGN